MTRKQWILIYAGGAFLMIAAIISDWSLRASLASAGGIVLGYATARL